MVISLPARALHAAGGRSSCGTCCRAHPGMTEVRLRLQSSGKTTLMKLDAQLTGDAVAAADGRPQGAAGPVVSGVVTAAGRRVGRPSEVPGCARRIGAFVALGLGLGAAAGVLWELVVDLPVYTIASDGAASTTERGLTEFFGGDAWFVAIGLLVGSGSRAPRLATVPRSGLAAGAAWSCRHGPRRPGCSAGWWATGSDPATSRPAGRRSGRAIWSRSS